MNDEKTEINELAGDMPAEKAVSTAQEMNTQPPVNNGYDAFKQNPAGSQQQIYQTMSREPDMPNNPYAQQNPYGQQAGYQQANPYQQNAYAQPQQGNPYGQQMPQNNAAFAQPASATWTCEFCGATNEGAFCTGCGNKR
mgnify:CR=1 FL=1